MSVVRNNSGDICAKLKIEKTGEIVQFQIDSGATVNVIPANLVPNELEESCCTLKMYNKTNIQPAGKCQIVLRNPVNRKKYRVEFQVVSGNLNPLINRRAEQMKLITVIQNPFLTAQSTQIKSVISVPIKYFIHHYPRALFNDIPRVGAHFYDIPGSGRTFTTYPGRGTV